MSKLILIVEDSKTLAMYEKSVLSDAGYEVVIAYSVDEAKQLVAKYNKNIIISIVDINLPDIEGDIIDFLQKYDIPAIAMTGSFHPELREKVVNSNIIDYIVLDDDKGLEQLRAIVSRVIENHRRAVLIVDDSNASRSSLKKLLLSQNFMIHEAANAAEALDVLRRHEDIEVALIDYEMPDMNGADLTRIIRKNYSRMELAVLAISVHTKSIVTVEFLKAGANDFITKPYVKEEVLARIAVNIDLIEQRKSLEKEIEEHKYTEVKLKESEQRAQSATLAKSNFLANMSHEIRTPMNAIIGFVDYLYKHEDDAVKLEKLSIIKKSGNSLLQIINDILDFSKIESGKMRVEDAVFDTREPFMVLRDLFQKKADEKNITLSLEIDDALPQQACGDETKLKQIYSNLLSNAIKFSKKDSSIEILVKAYKDNALICSVKDYGVGIATQNLEKVFQSFEQEDDSTTRLFGGTGLGLSISRSLAQAMHGDIVVESALGAGSTFSFYVTLFDNVACHPKEPQEEAGLPFDQSRLSGRVLVVEDNKSNQLLMKLLLDEMGLKYDIANDGLEALAAFKKGGYRIILMDESMPNLDGVGATKAIRKLEKEGNLGHIPIVAVSANVMQEDQQRFIAEGMDAYIPKPVDAIKLQETLYNYLSKKD